RQYDLRRTRFLESKDFEVMRFWNDVVLAETDRVLEMILERLLRNIPHPHPLPKGEGAGKEKQKESALMKREYTRGD
ncbi:MAG: DUF559 domain-containing protein, partial [Candidatus Binatia bacterium]